MVNFSIERWGAIAPGLTEKADWQKWLLNPSKLDSDLDPVGLKQFAPMIRRRFGKLGKCAMGAALQVADDSTQIPCVFASRHGNAQLTLDLLSGIASSDDMSPTGFSLAVHNAISGLYTIARDDKSPVTSLAAAQSIILHTIIEAVGQLQEYPSVMCVIYDLPLPEIIREYSDYDFPFAIAFVVSREGEEMPVSITNKNLESSVETNATEFVDFVSFLTGVKSCFNSQVNGINWRIEHRGS